MNKKADLRDQIKEELEMKKLISVILAGAMMAGLCACGKTASVKETRETAKETTKETVESETEDSSGGQTESSNPHLLVLEGLSDQELFDFCRETINIDIVDGESPQSLIDRLPSARFGATPYQGSYRTSGITLDYSVSLDGKDYDHLDEVYLGFVYDDKEDTLMELEPDNNVVRVGSVVMKFYSGRGESVYEFFKSKYTELYPGAKFDDYKSDDFDEYSIYGENNEVIRIRMDHLRTCKKITVGECQYRQK